jgi:F-type H+-transporting ATPase subunit delta
MTGSIARRYAKAIFSLASDEGALEEIGEELASLAAVAADPDVGAALANPLLVAATREAIATTLAEQLSVRPITRKFLLLLADHQRLDQLAGISAHYRRLLDRALGRVRAKVVSAAPLAAPQRQALVARLEGLTGRTVLTESQIDPRLLSGILVEIEGKVYDGSLRTQLERLAASIAGGRTFL